VLWLGRRQNEDAVEWWGEWSKLRWSFYSSGGWESDSLGRMAWCSGTDLMIRFRLERGGDGTKHYQKIKRRHRAHLDSMRRKRDMGWRCVDVDWRRDATKEGKGRRWRQLSLRESYYAKNWKKSMWSIQLLEIGDADLKQRWVNLIFLNILKWDLVLFISSCRTQWWKYNFKCVSYEWDKLF
jgi:hypothetical protein